MEKIQDIIKGIDDTPLKEMSDLTAVPPSEQLETIIHEYVSEALDDKYDPQMKLAAK